MRWRKDSLREVVDNGNHGNDETGKMNNVTNIFLLGNTHAYRQSPDVARRSGLASNTALAPIGLFGGLGVFFAGLCLSWSGGMPGFTHPQIVVSARKFLGHLTN